MNVWIKRMSTLAACFLVIIGTVLIINHLNQPVIIDENGFYIEDGVRIANQKTDIRADILVEEKYYDYKLDGKTEEDWLTNPNGIQYLVVTDEYGDPVKVYNILFRYADTVVCDFAVNQYQSDPKDYFDTVIQPLINSAVVTPDESYSEPNGDSLCISKEVNTFPAPAGDARITSKLMGGSPYLRVR